MSTTQNPRVNWKNVPTRTITAGGVEFAYRELGTNNPGTPVVFRVHLAAVLDNWDPRVVDGFAAKHHVVTFDNRGIGASSGAPATSTEQMAKDAITFIKAMGFERVDLFGFSMGGMIAQEIVLMEPPAVQRTSFRRNEARARVQPANNFLAIHRASLARCAFRQSTAAGQPALAVAHEVSTSTARVTGSLFEAIADACQASPRREGRANRSAATT